MAAFAWKTGKKRADPKTSPMKSFWERMPERPDPYDLGHVLLQMRKNEGVLHDVQVMGFVPLFGLFAEEGGLP